MKKYTGINIQWPISAEITSGKKTIETRTYDLPEKYLNQEMLLIETPGKKGKFKARITAVIIFTKSVPYKNKTAFYKDKDKHLVDKNSDWAWTEKSKWGWHVKVKKVFKNSIPAPSRKGIVFTKDIQI